jgi:hypothetical protein
VLIIIVRVLISKPQSIPFHPCFLERLNRCIRLRSCSCLGGLRACSQYVPIVEKVIVWWRSARGQPLAFYGSWTLFTLAHHNTVWLSTELVDPGLLPMLSWVSILLSEMRRWQLSSSVASLWRDFESRTLKPFPFGRALHQPGIELQTPVLCLNGPTWGKTGKECGRDN